MSSDYACLYLDHAAGALSPAAMLVVSIQNVIAPERARQAMLADVLGGVFLDDIAPVQMATQPLMARHPSRSGQEPVAPAWALARALVLAAWRDPDAIAWRWRWFGVRGHELPVAGAGLLRMGPGAAAPRHGHCGAELTLVLSGCFDDETGRYTPGDIAFAEPGQTHRPRTPARSGCVCLTVRAGAHGAGRRAA